MTKAILRFTKYCPSKAALAKHLNWMEGELSKLASPIVFCHNDLLLGNILYDESKETVSFIDFEYAAPNYQAYDIANHFCEFAGKVKGVSQSFANLNFSFVGVDDYDPSRYPSESFRREWISEYLKSFHDGAHFNDKELQALLDNVEKFSMVAHYFWGVWSLIQAAYSSIDFDFVG